MEDKNLTLAIFILVIGVGTLFALAGYRLGYRKADMSTQYVNIDSTKYIMYVDKNQVIKVIGIVNKIDSSYVY
jgi:hypothetical protein